VTPGCGLYLTLTPAHLSPPLYDALRAFLRCGLCGGLGSKEPGFTKLGKTKGCVVLPPHYEVHHLIPYPLEQSTPPWVVWSEWRAVDDAWS